MRAVRWLLVTALVATACSGDDDAARAGSDLPVSSEVPATTSTPQESVPETVPPTTEPPELADVTMSVTADDFGLAARLTATAGGDTDPFGDFATCSGQADRIGAYAVGVGDADGSVRWLSVVTADRVDGPGSYDADVRIELGAGDEVVAIGTLTLDAGLASGSFRASTPDGAVLDGDFACSSPGAAVTGPPVGDLVEVVVLAQMGDAERVLTAISEDPAVAACPSGIGDERLIVGVDGESPSTGSISQFALFDADADAGASIDMVVGGATYRFDRVDLTLADDRQSGVYAAAGTDGVRVDGAFSCTFG